MPGMFESKETYITPYLTPAIISDMEAWREKGKPVFQRVIPEQRGAFCRNCGDLGVIFVSFCAAGPFQQVPSHSRGEAIFYHEGGAQAGAGWYVVGNPRMKKGGTMGYPCPHCQGKPHRLPIEGPAAEPPDWWIDA